MLGRDGERRVKQEKWLYVVVVVVVVEEGSSR